MEKLLIITLKYAYGIVHRLTITAEYSFEKQISNSETAQWFSKLLV